MVEVTIVGAGFSAFLANLIIGDSSLTLSGKASANMERYQIYRRLEFEKNKFFGKKSISATKLEPLFEKIKLHDRLSTGGNSSIWGGVIDLDLLPKEIINILEDNGVVIQPISLEKTGSISNKSHLAQLQDSSGRILDVGNFFSANENNFLESFFIDRGMIGLRVINSKDLRGPTIIYTKRLIICTGVVQTIDLFYRSGFIGSDDRLSLSEFGHQISMTPALKLEKFGKSDEIITVRFDLARAACHFLGVQQRKWLSNFFRYVPVYVDQKFYFKNNKYYFIISDGKMVELQNDLNMQLTKTSTNGNSIHYCNLEINSKNANQYLNEISPNITGLGMSFVTQVSPGPISNDIALDAFNKLSRLK